MKKLCLDEIKKIEFGILLHFKEFCDKNNITFYLSNGTLLGAVKYKGFIPWDDDVDVFVPRADYDRLIELYADTDKYQLFSTERTKHFGYPFAKLCDMTTIKAENGIANGTDLGLDIDIFPLDAWANNIDSAKREVKTIKKYMYLLYLAKSERSASPDSIKHFIGSIVRIFCKLLGTDHFIKRINKLSKNLSDNKSTYLGCKSWCIYGDREIIPSEVFSDISYVEFEGERLPAPIGYDTYLRSLYGDYRQDPPPEKQKTHHTFAAYLK